MLADFLIVASFLRSLVFFILSDRAWMFPRFSMCQLSWILYSTWKMEKKDTAHGSAGDIWTLTIKDWHWHKRNGRWRSKDHIAVSNCPCFLRMSWKNENIKLSFINSYRLFSICYTFWNCTNSGFVLGLGGLHCISDRRCT